MDTENNKKHEIYAATLKYVNAGLEVIYNHPTEKNPQIKDWQTRGFTVEELRSKILNQGWNVGIRNIEGLDFDNNGNPNADELLNDWKELVHKDNLGLVDKLLIEKTRRGGFHVVWDCEVIEGNQKLAVRPPTEKEKIKTPKQNVYVLIETRGKGGQFVVSPSPGYTLMQGDWCNLYRISPEERLALLRCAKVFDRMPKIDASLREQKETYIDDKRPGDIYNDSEEGKNESLQLLIDAGWTKVYERENTIYLCRPGKSKSVSATFGYIAPGVFYNFSSSGAPFDTSHAYSPFAVYSLLKCNGDFSLAAKELSKRPEVTKYLSEKSEPLKENINFTDLGNATKIAEYFGDRARFDHKRKRWLIWHSPRWQHDVDGEIYRLAIKSAKKRFIEIANTDFKETESREKAIRWVIGCENKNRIDAACGIAKNLPPFADSGDRWDQNPMLLSCVNGIVDLHTGLLRDGRPEDSITMSTGIRYDPVASCPLWINFLNEIFDGNVELINYIQKALGYSLTGNMSEQVLFFCYGSGANGKSVFFSVLQKVFGDYGHYVPFSTFQSQGVRGNTNDLAALESRRFVVSSESLGGKHIDETVLKSISGGDPISARYLYGEFSTFTPHCKIWFFINHKPIVKDDSNGFWRRVHLIPFTHTFEKEKQDKQLTNKLQAEAEGILSWLVEGALLWQADRLIAPKAVEEATALYKRDSDTLADFIYEECIECDDVQGKAEELWIAYDTWARKQGFNEKERLGAKSFYIKIAEKFTKVSTKKGKIYEGISLNASSGDGSLLNFEASVGSVPKNTNFLYSTSRVDGLKNKVSKASLVTEDDNEINEVVENYEISDEEKI